MNWDCHRCVVYAIIVLCGIILLSYAIYEARPKKPLSFVEQMQEMQREEASPYEAIDYSKINDQEKWVP